MSEIVKELQITICDDDTVRAHQLPETGVEIGGFSLHLSDRQRRTIQILSDMLRQNRLTSYEEFRILGEHLYAVLFDNNNIGKTLNQFLQGSEAYAFKFLKIKLEFEVKHQGLEHWPWEYLFCPDINAFLSARDDVLLTRLIRLKNIDFARSLRIEDSQLIILFVAASPEDSDLGPVQYETVLDTLRDLEKHNAKNIKVAELVTPAKQYNHKLDQDGYFPEATFESFIELLRNIQPHVLHFVGHGKHTSGEGGELAFMKLDFTAEWVDDRTLVNWLSQIRSLRLVFLQACDSVSHDYSPYIISGVANYLAHLNIPAVIAMKYEIDNDIANIFATAFYQALAGGSDVDVAVQEGRSLVALKIRNKNRRYAFGLPTLYLRGSGGLISKRITQLEDFQGKKKRGRNQLRRTDATS